MFLPKKFQIVILSLIIALSFLLSPLVLAADPAAVSGAQKASSGLDATAKAGGVQSTTTDLPTIIGKVVGAILAFTGVVFFCLILWAGFGWMLAKGNEEEIKKAKETLIHAVLGLIVILGAYAITNLVAKIFGDATGMK